MRAAIILAGGSGTRMNNGQKKEFIRLKSLNNKTILESSVNQFCQTGLFDKIVVVTRNDLFIETENLLTEYNNISLCSGGRSRQESVYLGLAELVKNSNSIEIVLIHDGARPWVDSNIIQNVVTGTERHRAAIAVEPSVNAMKIVDSDKKIINHLSREETWSAQTPQGFYLDDIISWHSRAKKESIEFIDDSMLASYYGQDVYIAEGSSRNRKVTYMEDIEKDMQEEIRIGQGWDRHRLSEGNSLVIGGCKVESEFKSVAHSDGDVLIHAIIDAILGAASLGDIGNHFPPSDNRWKNANSMQLLSTTISMIEKSGFSVGNIDTTVVLEKPKLKSYIDKMRNSIAKVLKIDIDSVSVKAKTAESVDAVGEGNAIEAQAVVILKR